MLTTAGLTSIIVPAFNHARFLPEALASAFAQTAPVEVLVVDDGSTDDTRNVLARMRQQYPRLRVLELAHVGASAARNAGLEAARGEFIQFLDADDLLAPDKVARQLAVLEASPLVGWVLCDVRIEDAVRGRVELASERYRYPQRNLGGWIREELAPSNFVPIMAPLVRASVLAGIRFGELLPEDWHFWYAVAGSARVAYLPEVLATYRKQRNGRNASRKGVAHVSPDHEAAPPLRLNLGCGTPGTRSWHPIRGCVNLDRSMGWCFEDGLPQYADRAVSGITVSHSLMYVDDRDWPRVFAEFARVLAPGGVIRITEDDTEHPASSRRGGWRGSEPAVAQTSARLVAAALADAGLVPLEVDATTTHYRDRSLLQAQHGDPPDVFFLEGRRPSAVLFAPHHDDEALFAAFTIYAERPRVVVCYPSARDYGDTPTRRAETLAALRELGGVPSESWMGDGGPLGDLADQMRLFDELERPAIVWAPHVDASHPEHVRVAQAAGAVFGDRVRWYHTYDASGKVRRGREVAPSADQVAAKLRALACYRSQLEHPRARGFFLADLAEYTEDR